MPKLISSRSMKRQNYTADEEQDEEPIGEQQPPRKITKNIRGKTKKYYFLESVKTMKELDKCRFKNYCSFHPSKPTHISKSLIIPCSCRKQGKQCDFELMILAPDLEDAAIHVYAHAHHNHPIEQRKIYTISTHLTPMPDDDPPKNHRLDNIEWTFLQTFLDFDKVEKFRCVNQCRTTKSDKKGLLIRYPCDWRYLHGCTFSLLGMKTTKQRYHVYKHGKHSHPVTAIIPRKMQGQQNLNQEEQMGDEDEEDKAEEMEEDEEDKEGEEEENEEEGEEENEEEDEEEWEEEGEDEEEGEEEDEEEDSIPVEEEAHDEDDLIVHEEEDEQQQDEEHARLMPTDEIIEENPLENGHQPPRLEQKKIHEFHNVGAWLRRKR